MEKSRFRESNQFTMETYQTIEKTVPIESNYHCYSQTAKESALIFFALLLELA